MLVQNHNILTHNNRTEQDSRETMSLSSNSPKSQSASRQGTIYNGTSHRILSLPLMRKMALLRAREDSCLMRMLPRSLARGLLCCPAAVLCRRGASWRAAGASASSPLHTWGLPGARWRACRVLHTQGAHFANRGRIITSYT